MNNNIVDCSSVRGEATVWSDGAR